MAVTYGFYDSVGGDRKYNAEEFSRLFDGIIVDGVFHSVGDVFKVKPGTGMQVIVGTGRAWFDGTWTYNDADLPISLESPDVLGRIDAVVIEVNRDILHRKNEIKIIKGTPSTKPIKPTLTNTDTLSQHALAYVTIKSDATSIDVTNIEGVVGKSECPFVTGPLTTVDVNYLFSTWEGDFNEWFDTVKDTLSGDVAGNLLNEINKVREDSAYNTHCAIGDIITSNRKDFYPALTNPNYLPCDGRTVSPDDYPELADAVGVFYGAAKITGTFTPLSIEKHNGQVYCARQYGSYVEVLRFNTSTLQFELFESETFKDHLADKAALCSRSNGELVLVTKNGKATIAYMYTMSTTGVWSFTMSIPSVTSRSPWILYLSEDTISKDLLLCMPVNSSSYPTYLYQYDNSQNNWISRSYEYGLMYSKPLSLKNGGFVANVSQKIQKISQEGAFSVLLSPTTSDRDVFVMDDGTIIGDGARQYSKDDGQTWQSTTWAQGELMSYVSLPDNSVLALYSSAVPEEMMRTYDGITWHKNGTPRGEYSEANGYCTSNGIIIQERASTTIRDPYAVYNSGVKLADLPNFYVRCK